MSCLVLLLVCTAALASAAWGALPLGVVTWGRGRADGTRNAESDVPVPVCAAGPAVPCPHGPYLRNVAEVSAGIEFDLALLSDGKVVAWGTNEHGELGDGTIGASSYVPVEVSGLTNVKEISAGSKHSLALLNNGTVMAWGDGPLGNGTTGESDVPIPVCAVGHTGSCSSPSEYLSGVTAVSAGIYNSLALFGNGTVASMG